MWVKDIIIQKWFYLGDNTVNTRKIKIVIVDPNNTSKFIEVDFDKFYKIIWSYNITHIKKLTKKHKYNSLEIENRNSKNFNKFYWKNVNSLNAKIINNWEYNQELQNKRWDIIIQIKTYNYNKYLKWILHSYNQKTQFETKIISNWIVNLKTNINWVTLNLNFKENNYPFQKTKTRSERYQNKFYQILWIEDKEKVEEIDKFLYAEETINLIHFIQTFYINNQVWENKRPFCKSSWLVTLSGDLLIDDDLEKTKRSIKTQLLSWLPWLKTTWDLTILEEINNLWLLNEEEENKFIEFLNDLYEKYNKWEKS
jgi:hypothetical protein